MAKRKSDRGRQFGVLPWRIGSRGTREVMLLTSRETHRWVIPKGWPMRVTVASPVVSQEPEAIVARLTITSTCATEHL